MPYRAKTHRPLRMNVPVHRPRRRSASQRGHGAAWRRPHEYILRRHPLRADPFGHDQADGQAVAAAHVDRVVPRSAEGRDDKSNLQGLCETCHARKTVLHDGGFGRVRSPMQATSDS